MRLLHLSRLQKYGRRGKLIERFKLSDIQAEQLLKCVCAGSTGLEQDKLRAEYDENEVN
jgi:DNA gyrase/topoisomerase IV subunit A